jgi:RNase P subunit RPR2
MVGYCMKCRSEQMIANSKTVTMKNGRPATEGQCPDCGTRMYRLGKK